MTSRHLLTSTPTLTQDSLHLAAKAIQQKNIMGLSPQLFFLVIIVLAVVITVCCCVWVSYRRHRTLVDYNQNPEQFPHVPDLSSKETRNLRNKDLKSLIPGEGELKVEKKTEDMLGPFYKVTFKGKKPQAAYFDYLQEKKECCYMEIEVFNIHGEVEIGFAQKECLEKVTNLEEGVGVSGVSLSTSGLVVANGENLYNYNWTLDYGDVIGLGITKETDKFNERRAWISKNGVLLNLPPHDQMDKWLATVQIDAAEREKFNLDKEKEKTDDTNKDAEAADKALEAQKLAFEREQTLLTSQRVSLKTFKEFGYYPVLFYEGVKGEGKASNRTLINLNVGGQIFRMKEEKFNGGVLK